ncbi:MAG: hypothetical protein ACYSU7_15150 [Planctomycetota bacterium]
MTSLKQKLRHAFAVDPPGPATPTAEQKEVVDSFCRWFARRHLTTPGLILLEISRPLNWVVAQAGHFFSPGVWAVTPEQTHRGYQHFVSFLESRGSIEHLARRIEHFEQEYERMEKERDARARSGDDPDNDGAEGQA